MPKKVNLKLFTIKQAPVNNKSKEIEIYLESLEFDILTTNI